MITSQIKTMLNYLYPKKAVFEVCVIDPKNKKDSLWNNKQVNNVAVAYCDSIDKAAVLIKRAHRTKPKGIYVTLNPCDNTPTNSFKANSTRTKDREVPYIKNILIDVDPVRPADTNSTEDELQAALAVAKRIRKDLKHLGKPLLANSGNGAHLIYKANLPNTEENVGLIRNFLKYLANCYDTDQVEVDQTVFNPGRLVKVYGTMARKGPNTKDRPHRWSKIIKVPQRIKPISIKALKSYVLPNLVVQTQPNGILDVEKYLQHYHILVSKTQTESNRTIYGLKECIFDKNHTPNEASIIQTRTGQLYYQCFHKSCNKTWKDVRQRISGSDTLEPFMTKPLEQPRIRILTAQDIMHTRKQEDPIINGLLGHKESLMIYGSSGIGKSIISINIALHLAVKDILWNLFPIPKPIRTLFIQSENGADSLRKRLGLIVKQNPNFEKALNSLFYPSLGDDVRLVGDLLDSSFQQKLIELVYATGVGLIVIDPLISYHTKNENDNAEMRKALDALSKINEETNSASLLIHHAGKGGLGARGASAINDWAANAVSLERNKNTIHVTHTKHRDFECFHEFYLDAKNLLFQRTTDRKLKKVVNLLKNHGRIKTQTSFKNLIVEALKVSESSAYRLIERGVASGLIARTENGKSLGYSLVETTK